MLSHFPQAVPEIPVSNVDQAAEYYVKVLGFSFDWGNDDGGIGGISQGDCRMFLTNVAFRAADGAKSPGVGRPDSPPQNESARMVPALERNGGQDYRGSRGQTVEPA